MTISTRDLTNVPLWDTTCGEREALAAGFSTYAAYVEAAAAAEAEAEAARASLLAAARIARASGFSVRSSKDRAGRVSSYYATKSGRKVRISDHRIPETERRAALSFSRGELSYDGFNGAEVIIDRPRSALWIRRAIALAFAGRVIPGQRI